MTSGKLILIHKKQQQHECSKPLQSRTAPEHRRFTTKAPVRLNNIGVGLLMVDRNEDALKVFTKALKLTKAFLLQVAKHGGDATEVTPASSPTTPTASPTRRVVPSPIQEHHNIRDSRPRSISFDSGMSVDSDGDSVHSVPRRRRPLQASRKRAREHPGESRSSSTSPFTAMSDLFLFSEPITVDEEECPYTQGRACLMKLSTSIMFNMALAHHKKGLSKTKPTEATRGAEAGTQHSDLKKALALYELSCRMQHREKIELSTMAVLGHLNNMGHAHATLGNARMAGRCIRQLLKKLVLHKKEARKDELGQNACLGFHQNAASMLQRSSGAGSLAST